VVGAVVGRRRLIQLSVTRGLDIGRRRRFVPGNGELLQPTRRSEELVAVDVRVACDGREVGVAEVLGDEAGVAYLRCPRISVAVAGGNRAIRRRSRLLA